jgi:hypothetical protein
MIVIQDYRTSLKKSDIDSWIQSKLNQNGKGFLSSDKFSAKSDENGFYLREIKQGKHHNIKYARTYGKYIGNGSELLISLKIFPSFRLLTIIVFTAVMTIFLAFGTETIESGVVEDASSLSSRLLMVGAVALVLAPIIYFGAIRTVNGTRALIENELKLEKF